MERVDKQIGVIIDALDASGQGEDTVVILTSVWSPRRANAFAQPIRVLDC